MSTEIKTFLTIVSPHVKEGTDLLNLELDLLRHMESLLKEEYKTSDILVSRMETLQRRGRPLIFVFGSNTAGRHGAGAAKSAIDNYGAVYGQGEGLQGSSYALPTKDDLMDTLPLGAIRFAVIRFLKYAKENPHLYFKVTPIGCGLAGYKPEQIAPMFKDFPENVGLPKEFIRLLEGL